MAGQRVLNLLCRQYYQGPEDCLAQGRSANCPRNPDKHKPSIEVEWWWNVFAIAPAALWSKVFVIQEGWTHPECSADSSPGEIINRWALRHRVGNLEVCVRVCVCVYEGEEERLLHVSRVGLDRLDEGQ